VPGKRASPVLKGPGHGNVPRLPDWPAGPKDKRRDQVIYYSYKADRARRTLRGIDEQVAKAAKAVAGLAPVKRNRFIKLDGAAKSVKRELEANPGFSRNLTAERRA
jgi:hypothetical protein